MGPTAIYLEKCWRIFVRLGLVMGSFFLFSASGSASTPANKIPTLTPQFLSAWQSAPDYVTWKKYHHQALDWAQYWQSKTEKEAQTQVCHQLQALVIDDLLLLEDPISELPDWECLAPVRQRTKAYWQEKRNQLWNQEMEKQPTEEDLLDSARLHAAATKDVNLLKTKVYDVQASAGPVFFSADLPKKYVALTLDDGPHAVRTEKILDTLRSFDTQVTFFSVGQNTLRLPHVLKKAARQGHSMGTHSQTHLQLNKIPYDQARHEIVDSFASSIQTLGFVAPFFRFPYGARTEALQDFVKTKGWATFFWNIDTLDWKIKDPTDLLARCKSQITSEESGIILFHDIHQQTVEVMPWLLRWLAQNNYQPVVFRAPLQRRL